MVGTATLSQSSTAKRVRINSAFHQFWDDTNRYKINFGGRRSSKSTSVSQLLVRLLAEHGPRRLACLRKVGRTLRLSLWPRMISAIDESIGLELCSLNKSDMSIILPNGSVILFLGMDEPEKIKSAEGITDAWWEEATEFVEHDFDTVDAGLSGAVHGGPKCSHWFTFNPLPELPGDIHWLQRRFMDRPMADMPIGVKYESFPGVSIMRSTYKENAFCPLDVVDVLEGYEKTNPDLYAMWALGVGVRLKGAILDDFDVVDDVPDFAEFVCYGLDFGFANDPAALVAIWKHRNDLWVREELYAPGYTNQRLCEQFRLLGITPNHIIRADNSEPKSIAEIKAEDFRCIPGLKGPDYKRAAALWFKDQHIHMVAGSSNLIRELPAWSWEQDRHGNMLPRPADGNDHTVDALIYGAYRKQKRQI